MIVPRHPVLQCTCTLVLRHTACSSKQWSSPGSERTPNSVCATEKTNDVKQVTTQAQIGKRLIISTLHRPENELLFVLKLNVGHERVPNFCRALNLFRSWMVFCTPLFINVSERKDSATAHDWRIFGGTMFLNTGGVNNIAPSYHPVMKIHIHVYTPDAWSSQPRNLCPRFCSGALFEFHPPFSAARQRPWTMACLSSSSLISRAIASRGGYSKIGRLRFVTRALQGDLPESLRWAPPFSHRNDGLEAAFKWPDFDNPEDLVGSTGSELTGFDIANLPLFAPGCTVGVDIEDNLPFGSLPCRGFPLYGCGLSAHTTWGNVRHEVLRHSHGFDLPSAEAAFRSCLDITVLVQE